MSKISLKNKRIVLTRKDNEALSATLKSMGAEVIEMPLIDIELTADPEIAEDILSNIATYQWLIFSSANGVQGFFKEFFKKYKDIRCIGPCRIAAVGKRTEEELKKFFIQTDVVPDISTGDEMAKAVLAFESLENLMVLNVAGNLQDDEITKILQTDGKAIVDTFPVYKSSLLELDSKSAAIKDFAAKGADAIFFASSSAVQSFVKNASKLSLKAGATHPKAFSIGPKTSAEMKKSGITVVCEANSPEDVIECILQKI